MTEDEAMPVVRGREVKVTNEDVESTTRSRQQLITRPQEIVEERPSASLADRALLRLYVNVSSLLFCLLILIPSILWVGTVFVRQYSWPISAVLGASFAAELRKTCPPDCTWHNLLMWAILGGVGLLISLLLSNVLRRRLLKAIG
jgi:hypothetical protein